MKNCLLAQISVVYEKHEKTYVITEENLMLEVIQYPHVIIYEIACHWDISNRYLQRAMKSICIHTISNYFKSYSTITNTKLPTIIFIGEVFLYLINGEFNQILMAQ